MNGKTLGILIMALALLAYGASLYAQDTLASLRGAQAIDEISANPTIKQWEKDRGLIARAFIQQPPVIPHTSQGYEISLQYHSCLACHSWATYLETGATKISQTHFSGRDGIERANISPSRYFCNQCHVSQRDVVPPVENEFEPIEVMQE